MNNQDAEWAAAAKVIYDKGGIAVTDRAAYLEDRAEIARHHRDFERIRTVLDTSPHTWLTDIEKQIRNIVG